ncbi:MAG: metalloregulator ArsR/SmtB family transcription factor [Pseudomonadota bacterium]
MQTDIQRLFRGLADPTRRELIAILANDEHSISGLAARFDSSRNAIVKHLKVLEDGGIVGSYSRGKEKRHFLRAENLKPAYEWLSDYEKFWDNKLLQLKSAVEESRHE